MVKEEFYFDSRDGESRLHAVRYRPDDGGRIRGVLQVVHGMAEYVERYEEFARFLVEKGFVVTGEDHLGHGKSVGEKGKYGYFCEQDPATVLVRDVHRLKKLTEEKYPDVPYIIMGHSMGCGGSEAAAGLPPYQQADRQAGLRQLRKGNPESPDSL